MSIRGMLSIVASCAWCIAFAQSARADYFGLEVVDRSDLTICADQTEPEIPYKLDVCDLHIVFNNSADRVISVAFSNVSTTAQQGFFQHTLGGNTAPACGQIALEPTVECDSFVTLGVDCFDLIDGSTVDPDFDSLGFHSSGEVSGGWYNIAPSNGQGVPDANGRVMISRFSYKQNKNTSGDVCVFAKLAGSDEITAILLQPFDCSVPGGGLPAGGRSRLLGCVADLSVCGMPSAGSCFENHVGTIGCDCLECCLAVCEADPCCCDPGNGWDRICESEACADCDADRCQDCDDNDTPDGEDIDEGTYEDCNVNGIPDVCEIDVNSQAPGGPFYCDLTVEDCDPDCQLCAGGAGCAEECTIVCNVDCNDNGIPDDCEDCNGNGLADECDIADETSEDVNGNGIPDECEDCNGNGMLDDCELDCGVQGGFCDIPGCGLGPDCDGNGNLDECDIDMNSTAPGGPFFCDPQNETCDPDCNDNGIPDACDVAPGGGSADIDSNGVPDECQEDCNLNTIFDFCDVSCGAPGGPCQVPGCGLSADCNANIVPDECEVVLRGPVFLSGHDADDVDHCWGTPGRCGDLYGQLLSIAVKKSQIDTGATKKLLAIGVNGYGDVPQSAAGQALDWFNDQANKGPGVLPDDLIIVTDPAVISDPQALNFADFSAIYIPSVDDETQDGGMTDAQLAALNTRQADIVSFVNELNGGLLALAQANAPGAYGWLPVPLVTEFQGHEDACPTETLNLILDEPIDCDDLSVNVGPFHNIFTGPPGFLGLSVLAVSDDNPVGEILILGELDSELGVDCNGDGTPDSCQCPWDSTGDGYVGPFDLAILLGAWGPLDVGAPERCLDADGDGMIGPFDLAHLLGNWGPCCGDGLCYDMGEAPDDPDKWESCNSEEFEFICEVDCEECCLDGVCDAAEQCDSDEFELICEQDCTECCGDGVCDEVEICGTPFECEADCPPCP